jgi:MFS family permease
LRTALVIGACTVACAGAAFATLAPGHADDVARPPFALVRILRMPGLGRLFLVATPFILLLQAMFIYGIPSAKDMGASSFAAAALFFAMTATGTLGRIVWGRLADRDGGRRRMRTLTEIGVVAACGAATFALALHAGGTVAVVAAGALFGFGAFGWNALIYVVAGESVPLELAGQAVAVATTVVFLGTAIATPALGVLANQVGWDAFWAIVAALGVCGAVLARGYARRTLVEPQALREAA